MKNEVSDGLKGLVVMMVFPLILAGGLAVGLWRLAVILGGRDWTKTKGGDDK